MPLPTSRQGRFPLCKIGIVSQNDSMASKNLLYIAWILSVLATAGSLFFSEIMGLPPCVLCWHQRIAMYPLVIVLGVGILFKDTKVALYSLPLAVMGLGVAIYHNLLYYNIIPESIAPCTSGISCTTRQLEWLGFITIPLLSLVAFILITSCLVMYHRKTRYTATTTANL